MTKQKLSILIAIGILLVNSFGCSKDQKKQTEQQPEKKQAEKQTAQTQEKPTGPPKKIFFEDVVPMVLIPAGEFQMNDTSGEGEGDETSVKTIYLDAFYMDEHEVTNQEYARFMLRNKAHYKPLEVKEWLDIGNRHCRIEKMGSNYLHEIDTVRDIDYSNYPVVHISWYGAKSYAKFYGKRLPTEAEWEKAARGGLVGKKYPWGDDISHDDANYRGTGGKDKWGDLDGLAPVGSFAPNGYGLYDMAGNVSEWCADDSGEFLRVYRGGDWQDDADRQRVTHRYRVMYHDDIRNTYYTTSGLGFRCVMDLKP